MIPGFNNMLIMLIKGSALAGFIFLQDLTFVTEQLRRTLDTFTAFGLGLVIYFLISLICSYILRWMELRAQRRLGLKEARKPRTDKALGGSVAWVGIGSSPPRSYPNCCRRSSASPW